MYFTNNFQKRRRIYLLVSVLYVGFILVLFLIGDLGYFSLALNLLIAVSLIWRTHDNIKAWQTTAPLIVEKGTLTVSDVPKSVIKEALQGLAKQQKWRVINQTDQERTYRLVMDTPIVWAYLGDTIRITVHPLEDDTRMITIESHPKIPTTEFDHGRNKQHIKTILSFLSDELHSLTVGESTVDSAKQNS